MGCGWLVVSLALVIVSVLVQGAIGWKGILISADYMGILTATNVTLDDTKNKFYAQHWRSLGIIALWAMTIAFEHVVKKGHSIQLREFVTSKIMRNYMSDNNFYKVKLDNPDQRLDQDLEKFLDKVTAVCYDLIEAVLMLTFYTYQASMVASSQQVLLIYGFAATGIGLNALVIPTVTRKSKQVEKSQGIYRYQQVRITRHAESIALSSAAKLEGTFAERYLAKLIKDHRALLMWETVVKCITYTCSFSGTVIAYFIVGSTVISHLIEAVPGSEIATLGVAAYVTKYTRILKMLIWRINKLIMLCDGFGTMLGYYRRVSELVDAVTPPGAPPIKFLSSNAKGDTTPAQTTELVLKLQDQDITRIKEPIAKELEVKDTAPLIPNVEILVQNLSLDISSTRTLITGRSGVGKTSIVRHMAGLVQHQTPQPLTPKSRNYMILAQNSGQTLIPDVSWIDQISYPKKAVYHRYDEVRELIKFMGLEAFGSGPENLTRIQNTWNRLSGGEIQRVVLMRLLYHQPDYAVLDESFSALDSDWREKIFRRLQETRVIYLTIAHGEGYEKYHDHVLDF